MKCKFSNILVGLMTASAIFLSALSYADEELDYYYVAFDDAVVFKPKNSADRSVTASMKSGELLDQAADRLLGDVTTNQLRYDQAKGIARANAKKNSLQKVYKRSFQGFTAKLTPEAVRYLRSRSDIKYVQPETMISIHEEQSPVPSWGLDRIDERSPIFDDSFVYSADGTGVHLYVVDTGIRATHNEFIGRVQTGVDVVDNDNNPEDCNGHGTHVAGTAAGSTYGVAKNATIHAVKVLPCSGSGPTSAFVDGVEWILNNVQYPAVVNMSLGSSNVNLALNDAADSLIDAGISVVVAAGNGGKDACQASPSSTINAITVGSINSNGYKAFSSNFGNCVDLFAPGVSIPSALISSDFAYGNKSGTSMAAPHTSGVVAQILQRDPTLTPAEVQEELVSSATTGVLSSIGNNSPNRLLFMSSAAPVTITGHIDYPASVDIYQNGEVVCSRTPCTVSIEPDNDGYARLVLFAEVRRSGFSINTDEWVQGCLNDPDGTCLIRPLGLPTSASFDVTTESDDDE